MEDYASVSDAFDRAGIKTWELLALSPSELAPKVRRSVHEIAQYKNWYKSQTSSAHIVSIDQCKDLVISTGIPELDELLGGGLVPGSVTEVSGMATVGKTCLSCQIALQNINSSVYFTTEDKFGTIRGRMKDILQLDSSAPSSAIYPAERFFNVRDLASLRIALATLSRRVKPIDVVIIDSLGALISHIYSDKEAQIEIEELQLRKIAHELQAAIVVMNHVSEAKRPRNVQHNHIHGGSVVPEQSQGQDYSSSHSQENDLQFSQFSQGEALSYNYRMQSFLVEGDSAPDREFQVRPKHAMPMADFVDTRLVLMRLKGKSSVAREAKVVFSKWASAGSVSLQMTQHGLQALEKSP